MSILILDEHARTILALLGPEHAEIASTIREKLTPVPNAEDYREAAEREHASDDLEIDQGAPVSPGGDPGAWVQAWVWVTNESAGIQEDDKASDGAESPAPVNLVTPPPGMSVADCIGGYGS